MQIEEQVFKKHRDTQKVPLGGTVPPSVTPSQHTTTVQGQTCQQGEVWLGPSAAVDVHFSNQATAEYSLRQFQEKMQERTDTQTL